MQPDVEHSAHQEQANTAPNCAAIGARTGLFVGALYALVYGLAGSVLDAAASGGGVRLGGMIVRALGLIGIAIIPAVLVGGIGGAITGPLVCRVLRRRSISPSTAWLVGFGVALALFLLVLLLLAIAVQMGVSPVRVTRATWPYLVVFVLGPGAFYVVACAAFTQHYSRRLYPPTDDDHQ